MVGSLRVHPLVAGEGPVTLQLPTLACLMPVCTSVSSLVILKWSLPYLWDWTQVGARLSKSTIRSPPHPHCQLLFCKEQNWRKRPGDTFSQGDVSDFDQTSRIIYTFRRGELGTWQIVFRFVMPVHIYFLYTVDGLWHRRCTSSIVQAVCIWSLGSNEIY